MDICERILLCRLIEEMEQNKKYSKKLGLEDVSHYRGERIKESKRNENDIYSVYNFIDDFIMSILDRLPGNRSIDHRNALAFHRCSYSIGSVWDRSTDLLYHNTYTCRADAHKDRAENVVYGILGLIDSASSRRKEQIYEIRFQSNKIGMEKGKRRNLV